MTSPDFENMTKDEVLAWFDSAEDVSPVLASATPATESVARPPANDPPMMLASIRLPVDMIEQLDSLADLQSVRRSDIIRQALATYLAELTSPVRRDEAEYALDVLRRVVANRIDPPAEAA